MNKSKRSAVALLIFALAACASAPKPAPPPPPKPAPVPVVAHLVVPKPASAPPKKASAPAPVRPSVSGISSITFDGGTFALQYHGGNAGVALREYFQAKESAKSWTRLVELLVYPTAGQGITTDTYAAQVAQGYKTTYPYARFAVHPNKADGTTTLDFTAWTDASLQAHYLEYNVFKFFPAQKGGNLVGFHYVERIYSDPKATTEQNSANTAAIKQKVMAEFAKLPLYRE